MSAPSWQTAVIYQIYPRSFQDASGDGVGDLRGIEQRLDYVMELGADAIWLSPIFTSPMADFEYDIADYIGIDPLFGTVDDFGSLLAAAHRRDLKLILDLVPNHTWTSIHGSWKAAPPDGIQSVTVSVALTRS
jgi:alpha-glucosidase